MSDSNDPSTPADDGSGDDSSENALSQYLRDRFGKDLDPGISLDAPAAARSRDTHPSPSPTSRSGSSWRRLAELTQASTRYEVGDEIARGGMGSIHKAWDRNLRRLLAMKVLLTATRADEHKGDSTGSTERQVSRFLEEAQITGQLDHPGIVPVHELGLGKDGHIFFTMRMVHGKDLQVIIKKVHEGDDEWTLPRCLGAMQRVCETMAYAHSKGVIHRDLKPANVMVGRFGETYVMDWGLARVTSRTEDKDRKVASPHASVVLTDRQETKSDDPSSPLLTLDGDVVGTPAYMAPEQARGERDRVDARSDVYSVGAMLYHLLTGQMPYFKDDKTTPQAILIQVLHEEPVKIHRLARQVPAELAAICEKAMARNPAARYSSMQEMGDDLRAYLEGHVVRAHQTGAVAEFRKWVGRNRGVAASLVAVLLLVVGGALLVAWQQQQNASALEIERARTQAAFEQAQQSEEEAIAHAKEARANAELAKDNERLARQAAEQSRNQGYVANLLAADASLRDRETEEARRRLAACAPEMRRFEWQALQAALDTSIVSLNDHRGAIDDSVSNPGLPVRLPLGDTTLELWPEAATIAIQHFSPNIYSRLIQDQVLSVQAFPDGLGAAVSVTGGGINLVRFERGTPTMANLQGHQRGAQQLAFRSDGLQLLSASADSTARLWDIETRREVTRFQHPAPVHAAAYLNGEQQVLTACADGVLRVFDTTSPEPRRELTGHRGAILSLAVSEQGDLVATGSEDQTVRVWNLADSSSRVFQGHRDSVLYLSFGHVSPVLLSASADQTVRIWNLEDGQQQSVLRGHYHSVTRLSVSPDDTYLLTASLDGRMLLFDLLAPESRSKISFHGEISSASVARNGPRVAFAVHPFEVSVWDLEQETELLHMSPGSHPYIEGSGPAPRLSLSPDGETLILQSGARKLSRVDAATGEEQVSGRHPAGLRVLEFDFAGHRFATGSTDGSVRLFDASDLTLIEELRYDSLLHRISPNLDDVGGIAFSPDGRTLAAAYGDGTIVLFDLDTGTLVRAIPTANSALSLSFDPVGNRLAAAFSDRTARVYDVETGELLTTLQGHRLAVTGVAFNEVGDRIATCSIDGNVRVFESRSGQGVLTLRDHAAPLHFVAFSDDDRELLTIGEGGTAWRWHTRPTRELSQKLRAERRLGEAGRALVHRLLDQHDTVTDVIEAIDQDPTLNAPARRAALRFARSIGDDPWQLHLLARATLSQPDQGKERYQRAEWRTRYALSILPRYVHLHDRELEMRLTLAFARYRLGDHAAAQSELTRLFVGSRRDSEKVWALAFLALTQGTLGDAAKARRTLDLVDRMLPSVGLPQDASLQAVMREARERAAGS